ncbi:MAG: GAF domain-containing protein [Myxococcota bacterium]|jgi:hypothetical protein|nr:GAF domain-containing protein [Myxococcota bacterium]
MSETLNEREPAHESEAVSLRKEDFIETFFRRGAEFATELISELQSLRRQTSQLQEENLELRHHLASDDAIRELLHKIEALESEKDHLRSNAASTKDQNQDFAAMYVAVEKELDALANLYFASYQIHSTLDPQTVLGTIEQLLAQLVGTSSFVIYLARQIEGERVFVPIHAYHCSPRQSRIRATDGPIGEAARDQVHSVVDPGSRKEEDPIACIPMVLGNETIGVIAIYSLFEQKNHFVDIDFELFKMLSLHGASAIVGSGLMAQAGSTEAGLRTYPSLPA